jgi:hypothetical protein
MAGRASVSQYGTFTPASFHTLAIIGQMMAMRIEIG